MLQTREEDNQVQNTDEQVIVSKEREKVCECVPENENQAVTQECPKKAECESQSPKKTKNVKNVFNSILVVFCCAGLALYSFSTCALGLVLGMFYSLDFEVISEFIETLPMFLYYAAEEVALVDFSVSNLLYAIGDVVAEHGIEISLEGISLLFQTYFNEMISMLLVSVFLSLLIVALKNYTRKSLKIPGIVLIVTGSISALLGGLFCLLPTLEAGLAGFVTNLLTHSGMFFGVAGLIHLFAGVVLVIFGTIKSKDKTSR